MSADRRSPAAGAYAKRAGATTGLSSFIEGERARLFDAATPLKREQMRAAERRREVYRAWNETCAGTREGAHVTGLHYVPESNELVVYTDGASWTQEFTMLREIIRARMEMAGASVDRLVFKTTPASRIRRDASAPAGSPAPAAPLTSSRPAPIFEPLDPAERAAIAARVAAIPDVKLKHALENAMAASLQWKKGTKGAK